MAIVKNKKVFVQSVATLVMVDLGIQDLLFSETQTFVTDNIEYDMATVEGVAPAYNSFANSAKVIKKDGKQIVNIAPVNFNNSISKTTIDANIVKFGESEYEGVGAVDATTQSALDGVGKLHLNALVGRKKLFYEVLTTHKIAGGFIGTDGAEDIVFNVPANNLELFDGTILKYWSVPASSTPLDDMKRAVSAMKVKPRYCVMGETEYSNFFDSAQVITEANSTDTVKNFNVNQNVDMEADLFLAGRVMYKGMNLDVYVERGTAYDGSTYTPYMENYVVYGGSQGGATYYGGIPVAVSGGVKNISAVFDVEEVITTNPPQHLLVYRTAPLPVLKNGEAFFSQRVEA